MAARETKVSIDVGAGTPDGKAVGTLVGVRVGTMLGSGGGYHIEVGVGEGCCVVEIGVGAAVGHSAIKNKRNGNTCMTSMASKRSWLC